MAINEINSVSVLNEISDDYESLNKIDERNMTSFSNRQKVQKKIKERIKALS